MRHFVISIFLLTGLLGGFRKPLVAIQQETIVFRNVTVQGSYPQGITFQIEVCGRSDSSRVVFNYSVSADAASTWNWTREIWTIDEGETSDHCEKRKFYLETKELGIPPFAPMQYYWSVTEGSTVAARSPANTYYYQDGNQDWKNTRDENLIVWWHDRPDSFGQELMAIAAAAYQDQAGFYSTTLEAPIVIVIANTPEEFYAWQEKESYAGGMAFPDLHLTIQVVEEGMNYYGWSNDVIPHEISHIYFDDLVHGLTSPPHWLDEGVATFLEYSNHYEEWYEIKDAYQTGDILSLKDLEYDFGEEEQEIRLAYAESYYAVLYMDEHYGRESVSHLLQQYSTGAAEEAAFQNTFGRNPNEFEQDYLAWLETRIETSPPNNEIRKPLSKNELNFIYASLSALCLVPLCFIAFGAGAILVLWKLNHKSSGKDTISLS